MFRTSVPQPMLFYNKFAVFCRYLLAIGLESGALSLYSCSLAVSTDAGCRLSNWLPLLSFPSSLTHTSTIKRLQWRPLSGQINHDQRNSTNQSCQQEKGEREGSVYISTGHRLKLFLCSCSTDHSVKLFQVNILE